MATRNELATLHVRAEKLKSSLSSRSNRKFIVDDPTACSEQQELQEIFSTLILTDLSYSLEKKLEIDLWNFCFKNQISNLQSQVSVGNSIILL